MKKLLLLLLVIPLVNFGQREYIGLSSYYGYGAPVIESITPVNTTTNVTTTIRTIDYGGLAEANAIKEQNRIALLKMENEQNRKIAIEIAKYPELAFKYSSEKRFNKSHYMGDPKKYKKTGKEKFKPERLISGFQQFSIRFARPHSSFFSFNKSAIDVSCSTGWGWLNIDSSGVNTAISINIPIKPSGLDTDYLKNCYNDEFKDLEGMLKTYYGQEGKFFEGFGFIHKKELNRAVVYGIKGFKLTTAIEDDYEYILKDEYYAVKDKVIYQSHVVYKGDKDEVTFEDLEGRRYYFKTLAAKIIADAQFSTTYEQYGSDN